MDIQSGESHVLPIHATSAFSYRNIQDSIDVFEGRADGFVYGRYGNPTVDAVQNKLASLESIDLEDDAFCIMTASGLAAISTLCMSLLKSGDTILALDALYGGSTELLQKLMQKHGINTITSNMQDEEEIRNILNSNNSIKLIYFETPTNPTLKCVDIEMISRVSREFGITSAIDNTFSTAYLQRPLTSGIDYVVYSTTKFINGHGNSIAGAIIGKDNSNRHIIWDTMKLLGTNTNAWDAWLTHNGLKTLALRMDRACSNALQIAEYLSSHPRIKTVNYPGLPSNKYHQTASKQMNIFGAMLSFEIDGGLQEGIQFMDTTNICTIAATLGNVDTLLLHPVTSSHLNIDQETPFKERNHRWINKGICGN